MLLNHIDVKAFEQKWKPEIDLSFEYATQHFVVTFKTNVDKEVEQKLADDLAAEGSCGTLWVSNSRTEYVLGQTGQKVQDMLQILSAYYVDEELQIGTNHPYMHAPHLRVIWHEEPIIEMYVWSGYHDEQILIYLMKNVNDVEKVKQHLEEEWREIERQYQIIDHYLEPFVEEGMVTQGKSSSRSYAAAGNHASLEIYKHFDHEKFYYHMTTFLTDGEIRTFEDMITCIQKETVSLIKASQVHDRIVQELWKQDPYAFHDRCYEYVIDGKEHELEIRVEMGDDSGFEYIYRFIGNNRLTFHQIDELETYAKNELKKELGPKRLKSMLESGAKKHLPRLLKMYWCDSFVLFDDKDEINRELEVYFKDSRECTRKFNTKSDVLGKVYIEIKNKQVFVSLDQEKLGKGDHFKTWSKA